MKKYIIFTADIHPIGGMQNYVAGKVKYLEKKGWSVNVFFNGDHSDTCAMPNMNRFIAGGFWELTFPPQYWPRVIRNHVFGEMLQQIGPIDGEVIIESQSDALALWGEELASKIKAKHFCFNCNERFRGPGKYYAEYMDFFDFKHKRREIAGIKDNSMSLLFEGYKEVPNEENYVFVAANEGPVQDVEDYRIDQIKKLDWNIAYIGRIEKGYVNQILAGVKDLSDSHRTKSIQMVFVGDVGSKKAEIEQIFKNTNVTCVFLGNCVPIPRKLFAKLDVVVAGSGCARCAAYENVMTIVADADNYLANGVLGIDTFDTLYHEQDIRQMTYKEALENVLDSTKYNGKNVCFPKRMNCEVYYNQHFELIEKSNPKQEYYHYQNANCSITKSMRTIKFLVHMKLFPSW